MTTPAQILAGDAAMGAEIDRLAAAGHLPLLEIRRRGFEAGVRVVLAMMAEDEGKDGALT